MKTENEYLSDQELYEGLLHNDEYVLNAFFYGKQFDTVVGIIQNSIFKYDNFNSVKARTYNDLYDYLRKDDARKLHEYETEGGNFLIWLASTAIKYYQDKRSNERKTEKRRRELLAKHEEKKDPQTILYPDKDLEQKEFRERLELAISMMKNKKYAEIMRKKLLEDDPIILSFDSTNPSQDMQRAQDEFLKLYFKIRKKLEI